VIGRLSIVGLGLLGGSVAKAARAASLAQEIVGVGRNPKSLEPALRERAVDRITTDLTEGVRGADMIVLATPVATLERQLPAVWEAASSHALLTDVGSTKAGIVRAAEALGASRPLGFVGSHPMAGSNLAGYAVARPDLFRDATVVVTPTELTDARAVKRVTELWESLGARVVTMDPVAHDRAVAAISHLPHLVAMALVDAVARGAPGAFDVAARGFKDTTRIAASDPQMWQEIFFANRDALGATLRTFRTSLDELERLIEAGDAETVRSAIDRIRTVRERLS